VGKKAAQDFTSNKRQRHPIRAALAEALPLDSPNWMPLADAHRSLCPLLGDRHLAAKDLRNALADDDHARRVHSMRRCTVRDIQQSDCQLASYWVEHWLDPRPDGVAVMEGSGSIVTVKGYAFFVWKPDLEKIWPVAFTSTPEPPIKVQLTDKVKVQLVERSAPRQAKVRAPAQLTEDQIQALMGDVSKLSDTEKKLRRYTVIKYGDRWKDVFPANAMKAAEHDPLYEKEVGVARWTISTWRRALDRKK